jgi:hypothetical protein
MLFGGGQYEAHPPPPQQQNADGTTTSTPSNTTTTTSTEQHQQPQQQQPDPEQSTTTTTNKAYIGRRSGIASSVPTSLQKYSNLVQLTSDRALRNDNNNPLSTEEQIMFAGEVLFVSRPLVYLILSRHYQGRWAPWIISLAMDLISLYCTHYATKKLETKKSSDEKTHEREEIMRRSFLLLHYVLLSPAFDESLGPITTSMATSTKDTMLISLITSGIADMAKLYHDSHFYSAGSG